MAAIGDVSSTLLLRYYGSKTALFEAALIQAMPIGDLIATTERSQFGEVLARAFLDTRLDITPPSIIALAPTDAASAHLAQGGVTLATTTPNAKGIGHPAASTRTVTHHNPAVGILY